ncbi:NAD(P)/FAD-dependent oxidoreductase [Brevibacillus choshinensis]|uniref:FAD-dependent oxidoreductase n=1 Tax=Brevibacillus choshinensis TaxID=54911 RepID=A0ABX7FGE5_BRECH|nr:FAD-dependent oxidoreductase [Brevibacillus choshinensis]QRG65207.1 FAD-dependent oxidoreductase [Brevibacillus choshinensis]
MKVDVAVIGGGPAGLTAAKEIASRGGSVVVVDENSTFGGKLLGQLHEEPEGNHWWKGGEIAAKLVGEAKAAGVTLMPQTQVWGLEAGWNVFIADICNRNLPCRNIQARAVLLATGAVEKPLAMPGWTLPGVMTVGAAQVLTNVYRVKPGKRVVIAGVDVLSLTIARALKLAGVEIAGIVLPGQSDFTEGRSNPVGVLNQLQTMAHLAPNPMLRAGGAFLSSRFGIQLAARFYPNNGLKVWGIPLQLKKALVAIHGEGQVTHAEIASIDSTGKIISGTSTAVPVDAVCLSGGLTPLGELAATAGCKFVRIDGLSGAVPLHSRTMETTVRNLYVAGNVTGVEGAKIAMEQGRVAGKSICRQLGIGQVGEQDVQIAIRKVEETREKSDIQFHMNIKEARTQLQKLWEQNQHLHASY